MLALPVLLAGGEHEAALSDCNILGAIILEFGIASTIAVDLDVPHTLVQFCAVKVVTKHQFIVLRTAIQGYQGQ